MAPSKGGAWDQWAPGGLDAPTTTKGGGSGEDPGAKKKGTTKVRERK